MNQVSQGRGRERLSVLSERDYLSLQKPAQYLGGEKNSITKDESTVDVRIGLAFPDTYDVGMSHVGLQILYRIFNDLPGVWAERAFTPLPDMEALLRERGAPLCSLEGRKPLRELDVLGFSLQYELCGTNILTMLELGGIPFLATERDRQSEEGARFPLVIGGGPYCYHPEALAPFFDAFFIGDAEEFAAELVGIIRASKDSDRPRLRALELLRSVEGVYLPADFTPERDAEGRLEQIVPRDPARSQIVRRLLPSLEGAPYPVRPIVPNVTTVHNRLSVEVMRGCVRGCRFCQAGYLYRPQRERSPQEVLEMIQTALPQTGFEEVSLLSLSTADYCSIVPLLKALMDRYGDGDKLAISFPSTRVDALTPEVLEQVQRVRRTGFTVAPEGGTQRLRDVINKGVSDEQILETASNVFKMGWSGIKLYFMLGLPTETDEDLRGIIDIARRVRLLPEAQGKDITVSVSTHVPKPHTPFQWAAQITPEETIRKQRLLADGLRRAGVNFRYHDHFSSFLEGIFCRGGRELADVVIRAYELGCRLDAWKEHLDEQKWMQAFSDCNLNPYSYLHERTEEEVLPWDHLSCGIPKRYFWKEWTRALRDRTTPDCLTTSCSICGACDYDAKRNILWPRDEAETWAAAHPAGVSAKPASDQTYRYRVRYAKAGAYRFLGHLELVNVIHRAVRRADLPMSYSAGFHPLPRISFGPPLPLGITSSADFFDMLLTEALSPEALAERLDAELPDGLAIAGVLPIDRQTPSLQEAFTAMRYRVSWLSEPQGVIRAWLEQQGGGEEELAAVLAATVVRKAKGSGKKRGRKARAPKEVTFVVGEYLSGLTREPSEDGLPGISFSLVFDHRRACPNAVQVVKALSGLEIGDYHLEKIDASFTPSDEAPVFEAAFA